MSSHSSPAAADAPANTMSTTIIRRRIPPMTAAFEPLIPAPVERDIVPAPRALIDERSIAEASTSLHDSVDGECGPCTTFTCFAKLPAEIRLRIWKYMLPPPRVVLHLSHIKEHKKYLHGVFGQFKKFEVRRTAYGFRYGPIKGPRPGTVPVTLHICAESRHETLQTYTALGTQYIDFERDTLWIPSHDWFSFWELYNSRKEWFFADSSFPWVKSLLIEMGEYKKLSSSDITPAGINYKSIMQKFPNLTELIVRFRSIPEDVPKEHYFFSTNPNPQTCLVGADSEVGGLAEGKMLWGEQLKAIPRWISLRERVVYERP